MKLFSLFTPCSSFEDSPQFYSDPILCFVDPKSCIYLCDLNTIHQSLLSTDPTSSHHKWLLHQVVQLMPETITVWPKFKLLLLSRITVNTEQHCCLLFTLFLWVSTASYLGSTTNYSDLQTLPVQAAVEPASGQM